jgi:hypothetical protein
MVPVFVAQGNSTSFRELGSRIVFLSGPRRPVERGRLLPGRAQ